MQNEFYYRHVMKILHTDVRVYNQSQQQIAYYGYDKNLDPLAADPDFEKCILSRKRESFPVIYSEAYPLYYGILFGQNTIVVGPMNIDATCTACEGIPLSAYLKEKHHVPAKLHVPCCKFETLCEEICLLHYNLTGTDLTYEELTEKNYMTKELTDRLYEDHQGFQFSYHENNMIHNPYSREQRTLECIRNGDQEGLIKSLDEVFPGQYGVLANNPLRSEKNLSIVGISLATRAAIEAGMPFEESFSLSDSYIRKIDMASDIGEAKALLRHGQLEYCRIIREFKKEKQSTNRLVEDCKNLIYRQLHTKIRVSSLAEELGVTQEYLVTVFKRETGRTIKEYILEKKIRLSENMLIYSTYSIAEISSYLGFASQSHFNRVFQQYKGTSPSSYRNHYGKSRDRYS